MAGDVTGEVFEWREDLEETEEVSLRGRAFPGSLKAINLRTAWGLSAPGKKTESLNKLAFSLSIYISHCLPFLNTTFDT